MRRASSTALSLTNLTCAPRPVTATTSSTTTASPSGGVRSPRCSLCALPFANLRLHLQVLAVRLSNRLLDKGESADTRRAGARRLLLALPPRPRTGPHGPHPLLVLHPLRLPLLDLPRQQDAHQRVRPPLSLSFVRHLPRPDPSSRAASASKRSRPRGARARSPSRASAR